MSAVAAMAIMMMTFGVTLNPDGSGKAMIEITQSLAPPNGAGGEKVAPAPEVVRDWVRQVLSRSEGADTWADVSYGTNAEGLATFKGTVYFKNVKDLDKLWMGTMTPDLPVTWTKDPRGDMILKVDPNEGRLEQPPPQPPTLTEEELAKRVEACQKMWKQQQPMMEARMGGMKMDFSFKLPGAVTEVGGFKKEADGLLHFVFDGAKIVQAINQLMGDAAYVRDCIKAGLNPGGDRRDPVLTEKIFGTKGPWTARVAGEMKPQFDYDAEVKAAREAFPKMIERLGLDAAPAKAAPAAR